jgi:hypothetical protein
MITGAAFRLDELKKLWDTNDAQSEQELVFLEKCCDFDYDYDWDKILKRINSYWEGTEDVMLLPDIFRRAKAMERFEARLGEKARLIKDMEITAETDREYLLADFFYLQFHPALSAAQFAMVRIHCTAQMSDVAFSLAAWRSGHGDFPDTLEQLIPEYLDEAPVSLYTNKPLRYLKRANDVLLVNDETFLLDGSEAEVEKKIADAPAGDFVYPLVRSFIVILHKE